MNTRPRSYKKAMSAILIATNLLSSVQAEAAFWDWFGGGTEENQAADTSVQPSTPHVPTTEKVRPVRTAAPRTIRARSTTIDLSNGDGDGIMDDFEKQQMEEKKINPQEDAKLIGPGKVDEESPLYAGVGVDTRIVGTVKKDEKFSVVSPGANFSRVRFNDGRLGFIEKSRVIMLPTESEAPPVKPAPKNPPRTQPGARVEPKKTVEHKETQQETPQTPKKKLEADCDECKAEVKTPKAIDDKKIGGIADVSKHLNRKQAGGRATNRTRVPDAADEIQALSSGKIKRLATAARRQALACRVPADYLWARRGRGRMCGNVSKGKCYAGVKDALVEAGITKTRLPGVSAKDAHYRGYLKKAGMKNIMPSIKGKVGGNLVKIAQNAPAGAVLVYDGGSHGHGHIEIKSTSNQYCSDFCRNYPVNIRNARRLIAVYMP